MLIQTIFGLCLHISFVGMAFLLMHAEPCNYQQGEGVLQVSEDVSFLIIRDLF